MYNYVDDLKMTTLWHLNPFTRFIQYLCIIGENLQDGKSCNINAWSFKLEDLLKINSRMTDCHQCVKDFGKAKCKEGINQNIQKKKGT